MNINIVDLGEGKISIQDGSGKEIPYESDIVYRSTHRQADRFLKDSIEQRYIWRDGIKNFREKYMAILNHEISVKSEYSLDDNLLIGLGVDPSRLINIRNLIIAICERLRQIGLNLEFTHESRNYKVSLGRCVATDTHSLIIGELKLTVDRNVISVMNIRNKQIDIFKLLENLGDIESLFKSAKSYVMSHPIGSNPSAVSGDSDRKYQVTSSLPPGFKITDGSRLVSQREPHYEGYEEIDSNLLDSLNS